MKKTRYIACAAMAAVLLLTAVGCQHGGESATDPTNSAGSDGEAADRSEYAAKAEAAYSPLVVTDWNVP